MIYTYSHSTTAPSPLLSSQTEFKDKLITYTALMFGIEEYLLFLHNRTDRVKYARWMVWEIMYATSGMSLKEVAAIFGTFDHTSVVNALNKLEGDIEANKVFLKPIWSAILMRMDVKESVINELRRKRKNKMAGIIQPKSLQKKMSKLEKSI